MGAVREVGAMGACVVGDITLAFELYSPNFKE